MQLIDRMKFVVAFPPSNINTAVDNTTYTLGDYINMKNFGHLTIVLLGGASAGGTGSVTVKMATDASGTSADNVTIAERFLCTATATASDTWTSTAVTSNTWDHPATANLYNIIEIDSRDLSADHNWVAVNIDTAGGETWMSGLYILSEPRYLAAEGTGTAIA